MGRRDRGRIEPVRVKRPDDGLVLARRVLDPNGRHPERSGPVGDADELEDRPVFRARERARVVRLGRPTDEDDGIGAEEELSRLDREDTGVRRGHRDARVDRHREQTGATPHELDERRAATVLGDPDGRGIVENRPRLADGTFGRRPLREVRERDVLSGRAGSTPAFSPFESISGRAGSTPAFSPFESITGEGGRDVRACAGVGDDRRAIASPGVDRAGGVRTEEDVAGGGAGRERALRAGRRGGDRGVGRVGGPPFGVVRRDRDDVWSSHVVEDEVRDRDGLAVVDAEDDGGDERRIDVDGSQRFASERAGVEVDRWRSG